MQFSLDTFIKLNIHITSYTWEQKQYKVKIEGVARVEKLREEGYQIPVLQTREEVMKRRQNKYE